VTRVFVSYNRADEPRVQTITAHLDTGGYDVWRDREISGGQRWWDEILHQITQCDVFLPVVSPRFVDSVACRREVDYATAVNKPLLPVVVVPVPSEVLGHTLGDVQTVDYTTPSTDTALRLMAALRNLPPVGPLPHPLPSPPPAPVSYMDALRDRVYSEGELSRDAQRLLLADLLELLPRKGVVGEYARRLLVTFRSRRDLMHTIAEAIDRELLRRSAASAIASPSEPTGTGSKRESYPRSRARLPGSTDWTGAQPYLRGTFNTERAETLFSVFVIGLVVVVLLAFAYVRFRGL
jgi:hypothetical protein